MVNPKEYMVNPKELMLSYYMFRKHNKDIVYDPIELSQKAKKDLIAFLNEIGIHSIEYHPDERRERYNLKVERAELYKEKNSVAFEINIFMPPSEKPIITYMVITDNRGYHVAEIKDRVLSGVIPSAKTKEIFKELITKEFKKRLEEIL